MAHIYLTEISNRALKSEIENSKKGLIRNLIEHKGIEFIVVELEMGYEICGKNGKINIDKNFKIKEENGDVFSNIIETNKNIIIDSLKEIVCNEESGDIIIFGAVIGKNRIINFEEQYGGHGGIGGMQNYPFIISEREIDESELTISKFYSLFNRERE
jgi:putative membrane protein